jgi:hypothetical protein
MKINEVVQEGVWDTLKKVGAGVAGAVDAAAQGTSPIQGAKAGAAASTAKSNQQDLINRVTVKSVADWTKYAQTKQASGVPATAADAQQWFKNYTGGVATPTTAPAGLSPAQMQKWLSKEVASYMANKAAGTAAASGPADTDDQPTADAQPEIEPVYTVITPTGQKAIQAADNKWYREDGTSVDNPADIKQLNQMVISARETARAKGNPMPKVISAQTSQAANTAAQTSTTDATVQQSVGTQQPAPTTATNSDIFAGDTQQPEASLPDVSQLTAAERAELRKQLQA